MGDAACSSPAFQPAFISYLVGAIATFLPVWGKSELGARADSYFCTSFQPKWLSMEPFTDVVFQDLRATLWLTIHGSTFTELP